MDPQRLAEFRWRVVAYVMDGTGAYLMAVGCIVLAGLFFAHAFHTQAEERRIFQELLFEQSEPHRREEYQVANAAVMFELQRELTSEPYALCAPANRAQLDGLYVVRQHIEGAVGAVPARCPLENRSRQAGGTYAIRDTRHCNEAADAIASALGRVDWGAVEAGAFPSGSAHDSPTSVAKFYFITSTGVALLPRGADREVPPTHPLQAAAYVRRTLDRNHPELCEGGGAEFIRTRPYIDITGDGLVETVCLPVPAKAPYGAACIDRALKPELISGALGRLRSMFTVRTVLIDRAKQTISACHDCLAPSAGPALIRRLNQSPDGGTAWTDDAGLATYRVRLDDHLTSAKGSVLVLPAVRHRNAATGTDAVEAIVLKPRAAEVIELAHLMIGLCFLVTGGAFVFYSAARQRERERMRVLHGLPMPVVVTRGSRYHPRRGWRVRLLAWVARRLHFGPLALERVGPDEDADEILFANAAAESVLDEKLPRFPRAIRIGFLTRGVESQTVHRLRDWFQGRDRERYDAESKARGFGEGSTYDLVLARGRHRGQTVRITGAWLRRANGDVDSFGVIELRKVD